MRHDEGCCESWECLLDISTSYARPHTPNGSENIAGVTGPAPTLDFAASRVVRSESEGGSTGSLEPYPESHSEPLLAGPLLLGSSRRSRRCAPPLAVMRGSPRFSHPIHSERQRSRHQESDGSCRAGHSKPLPGKRVHVGVETWREWADEATDIGRSRAHEPASERWRPRPAFVNRTACRVPDVPGRSPVPIRPPEGGRSATDR